MDLVLATTGPMCPPCPSPARRIGGIGVSKDRSYQLPPTQSGRRDHRRLAIQALDLVVWCASFPHRPRSRPAGRRRDQRIGPGGPEEQAPTRTWSILQQQLPAGWIISPGICPGTRPTPGPVGSSGKSDRSPRPPARPRRVMARRRRRTRRNGRTPARPSTSSSSILPSVSCTAKRPLYVRRNATFRGRNGAADRRLRCRHRVAGTVGERQTPSSSQGDAGMRYCTSAARQLRSHCWRARGSSSTAAVHPRLRARSGSVGSADPWSATDHPLGRPLRSNDQTPIRPAGPIDAHALDHRCRQTSPARVLDPARTQGLVPRRRWTAPGARC